MREINELKAGKIHINIYKLDLILSLEFQIYIIKGYIFHVIKNLRLKHLSDLCKNNNSCYEIKISEYYSEIYNKKSYFNLKKNFK
jgi:hypothetical protein